MQRRAGAKGFGLFTRQDLQEGDFLMEYVGEVSSADLSEIRGQTSADLAALLNTGSRSGHCQPNLRPAGSYCRL